MTALGQSHRERGPRSKALRHWFAKKLLEARHWVALFDRGHGGLCSHSLSCSTRLLATPVGALAAGHSLEASQRAPERSIGNGCP